MKSLIVTLFLTVLVSGCGTFFGESPGVSSSTSSQGNSLADGNFSPISSVPSPDSSCGQSFDCQAESIINKIRLEKGLVSLTSNSPCKMAAQSHANDMASNEYFSHAGLNGSTPGERVRSAGGVYVGENIAMGQRSAQEVVLAWMNSPGHRANILSPHPTTSGLAIALNAQDRLVWVQEFCN